MRLRCAQGCDEAKEELQEVVEYLRNPDKFSRLGAKLPKVCTQLTASSTPSTSHRSGH